MSARAETLFGRPPGIAVFEWHPIQLGRLVSLAKLLGNLTTEAIDELREPKWEEQIYGFKTGALPENPPLTYLLMALLRAHQLKNPAGFYDVVVPNSTNDRQPEFRIIDVPDLGTSLDLPSAFQEILKQAETTGVFWTQGIQIANSVFRLQGLSPKQIWNGTIGAILSSYRTPDHEISLDYGLGDDLPPAIPAFKSAFRAVFTNVRYYITGANLSDMDRDVNFWGIPEGPRSK